MEYKRITIQIKGDPSDEERLRLYDFVNQLEAVRGALSRLEDEIADPGSSPLQYRVVDLSHKSPATVVLEVVPGIKGPDVSALIIDRFAETIKDIKSGSLREDFNSDVLEPFKRIGPHVQKETKQKKAPQRHLSLVTIITESERVDVAESLAPEIDRIVGPDELMSGSVTGTLELINIHEGANTFRIFPIIGPKKIDCHFSKNDLDKAISGINRYVDVRGMLRYKRRDKFPYAMDAREIEVYPDEKDLPSIFDLKGMAPNATGDTPSEKFVRRLRDESW